MNHQNNFATNLTSNTTAGATTTPLNSIPTIDAPFYLALDATNINSHYEIVNCTSKTATNVLHAATTYAHTTAEEVRQVFVATEMDSLTTGWNEVSDTWTYASATTFTISGDLTDSYYKGAKVKFTDGGSTTHKCYVVSSSYSSPNTTITVASEDNIASGTITSPYYSYADCPQGFKKGEDWYKARAWLSTAQDIPTGTTTKIELDSETFDINGNFSTSNNNYTAPITGNYFITASVRYNSLSASKFMVLYLYKNSSVQTSSTVQTSIAGTEFHSKVSDGIYLTKGDTIDIRTLHDEGSDEEIQNQQDDTFLTVNYLGL